MGYRLFLVMEHAYVESSLEDRRGRQPRAQQTALVACFWSPVGVSIIGSTALATIELMVALAFTVPNSFGERLPGLLVLAAFGKVLVTHVLVWTPLLVAGGTVRWLLLRNRLIRPGGPLLGAVFAALAGTLVGLADLSMVGYGSPVGATLIIGGALGVSVILYRTLRWAGDKVPPAILLRTARALTGLCALAGIISGVCFLRSPWFNPGAYRVPSVRVSGGQTPQRNILWIVLDTVRADRMSCYGYEVPTTPFLTTWQDRSVVFDHAISNGSWTVPAHASMFTGLSVREHGMDGDDNRLDDSFVTAAEMLAANGYATACFTNNPWISRESKLADGFQKCVSSYRLRRVGRFSLEYAFEWLGITPPLPWLDPDYGAAVTNWLVDRWLDEISQSRQPMCLFVNYMEAHLPYRVPKVYRAAYLSEAQSDRSYDLRRNVVGDIVTALDQRFNLQDNGFLSPEDREILKLQYDACIRYLDDRVAELIGMFEQRNLLDNTLVVISSDHGEHLDTHGMWSHRFLLHHDLTRVPLLVAEPGRTGSKHVGTAVQLSDIYPTVLRFALGEDYVPAKGDARDLLAVASSSDPSRIVISEHGAYGPEARKRFQHDNSPEILHRFAGQLAAQDTRFKFVFSSDGRRELFDLRRDPGELQDCKYLYPADMQRLDAYLQEWLEIVPRFQPPPGDRHDSFTPGMARELRGLGYLGEGDD